MLYILKGMGVEDLLLRGGFDRAARQGGIGRLLHQTADNGQSFRTFRVRKARIVGKAAVMGIERCLHAVYKTLFFWKTLGQREYPTKRGDMKKEFNETHPVLVTGLHGHPVPVQMSDIETFRDAGPEDGQGKAVIFFTDESRAPLFVIDSAKDIADRLNGWPSDSLRKEWEQEVIVERQHRIMMLIAAKGRESRESTDAAEKARIAQEIALLDAQSRVMTLTPEDRIALGKKSRAYDNEHADRDVLFMAESGTGVYRDIYRNAVKKAARSAPTLHPQP